jgi:DNA-binding beta-propeller fold protein YncE
MCLDRDGNVYVLGGRDNAIYRYDPAGKPLPFPGIGTHKIMTKGYRGYGPNMGFGGIAVDSQGNIYFVRNSNYGAADAYGGRVDVFGPDGKPKQDAIIDGLGYADSGLGVDAAGNIYVGSNLKPADAPLPQGFAGKVPDKSWTWWRDAEREIPWRYTYYNPYLFHWGAVFKFGPAGGAFYGQNAGVSKDSKYGAPRPVDTVQGAPADAVSLRSACLGYEVKVAGARWRYQGIGPIPSSGDALTPDPGCVCYNSHLAVDPWGRVYAPNVFRFSVEMLDAGGNQIARIGRYGNADSAGVGTKLPEPEIAFAWPAFVSYAGGKVFVGDAGNHRLTVVKFDHAAEESCVVR